MEDGERDGSGLTPAIPAIGDDGRPPAPPRPVGWLTGLLWPTIGAFASVGAIYGLGELRPWFSSNMGCAVWTFAFLAPVHRWFTRSVRNRGFAAWCAGSVWIALTGVLGVWVWSSPVLNDWRWLVIQTGTLWLAVIAFVAATHVRRNVRPSAGSPGGPA